MPDLPRVTFVRWTDDDGRWKQTGEVFCSACLNGVAWVFGGWGPAEKVRWTPVTAVFLDGRLVSCLCDAHVPAQVVDSVDEARDMVLWGSPGERL